MGVSGQGSAPVGAVIGRIVQGRTCGASSRWSSNASTAYETASSTGAVGDLNGRGGRGQNGTGGTGTRQGGDGCFLTEFGWVSIAGAAGFDGLTGPCLYVSG